MSQPNVQGYMTASDAFERLGMEVIRLEALASAANRAMDECPPPPPGERRDFDRAHALIGDTAEKARQNLELLEELRNALKR